MSKIEENKLKIKFDKKRIKVYILKNKRKLFKLTAIFIVIFIISIYFWHYDPFIEKNRNNKGDVYIRVLTNKDRYHRGENIEIYVIIIHNRNVNNVTLLGYDEITIKHKNGEIVYNTGGLPPIDQYWNLTRDSEKLITFFTWNQEYHILSGCIVEKMDEQVPIGTYVIRSEMRNHPDLWGEKSISIIPF